MSEGRKMWLSVMAVFLLYATIFTLFEDYDRKFLTLFNESSDWHLLLFSLVVLAGLAFMLYRYAKRMDQRINHEQAEKENRLRRELTQNIAHELKTPVASILGYVDTILQHPELGEDVKHQFIVRTQVQAQRLTALLQDISTLNRMDYATNIISMDDVNVSFLVADIVQESELALEQHGMVLRNCLPQGIIVKGNATLLYGIFRNLLDNAINYAGRGTTIEISAREEPNEWEFTFMDDGIGVSEEHLPRIFERFYRIDKGRSREIGGTGLGLSIVKNAVTLHGGSITASSPKTGGLVFQFTIKKNI